MSHRSRLAAAMLGLLPATGRTKTLMGPPLGGKWQRASDPAFSDNVLHLLLEPPRRWPNE